VLSYGGSHSLPRPPPPSRTEFTGFEDEEE
jgi:hypothetical protein